MNKWIFNYYTLLLVACVFFGFLTNAVAGLVMFALGFIWIEVFIVRGRSD